MRRSCSTWAESRCRDGSHTGFKGVRSRIDCEASELQTDGFTVSTRAKREREEKKHNTYYSERVLCLQKIMEMEKNSV